MSDYPLTDAERTRLLHAAMAALPAVDPPAGLLSAIAKITGTDTVLVARRAYPPHSPTHQALARQFDRMSELLLAIAHRLGVATRRDCPDDQRERTHVSAQPRKPMISRRLISWSPGDFTYMCPFGER